MSEHHPRQLPPVWKVLEEPRVADRARRLGHDPAVRAIRAVLDRRRGGGSEGLGIDGLIEEVIGVLEADRPALRPVINATGILLHTGLGRAPLSECAAAHVAEAARGYCSVELQLETGERGVRHSGVANLLRELTGAEAALVVNNNAAATVLVLRVLARGREVVVSRGELVEIGGSFRLPEIFEVSGARLREVGTTNKTRISDYAAAIGPETAAILRVHPSNYRIEGFTEAPGIKALCELAHAHGLPCVDDIGSGAIGPNAPPLSTDEPTMTASLAAGADVVLGSGDKLLGGPQCGLVVGRAAWIKRLESDPLMRALRVDKLTLAALEFTLREARRQGERDILLWRLMNADSKDLESRAHALAARIAAAGLVATAGPSEAFLGGGSCPGTALPSWGVSVRPGREATADLVAWSRALRMGDPSVVARIHAGALCFDLRTVLPEQDDLLGRLVGGLIPA